VVVEARLAGDIEPLHGNPCDGGVRQHREVRMADPQKPGVEPDALIPSEHRLPGSESSWLRSLGSILSHQHGGRGVEIRTQRANHRNQDAIEY